MDSTSALISGSVAGVCATLVGAPFDTIKVKLQTGAKFNGFLDCFISSITNEKFSSLYRGVVPAMSSAVTENATVFFSNALIKQTYLYLSPYHSNMKPEDLSLYELALVGGASGFFSSTAICPAETIKCRLQVSSKVVIPNLVQNWHLFNTSKQQATTVLGVVRDLLRREGFKGLYRGYGALLLRDVPFNFLFFGSYETICKGIIVMRDVPNKDYLHGYELVFAGGSAGVVSWTFCLPADVVKSFMQTGKTEKSTRLSYAVRTIYRTGGAKAFFRGYGAAIFRAFPVNGALFACYEFTEQRLKSILRD